MIFTVSIDDLYLSTVPYGSPAATIRTAIGMDKSLQLSVSIQIRACEFVAYNVELVRYKEVQR